MEITMHMTVPLLWGQVFIFKRLFNSSSPSRCGRSKRSITDPSERSPGERRIKDRESIYPNEKDEYENEPFNGAKHFIPPAACGLGKPNSSEERTCFPETGASRPTPRVLVFHILLFAGFALRRLRARG
jgi:hypothetical protein